MFTLNYLKDLKQEGLKSSDIRNDIKNQLFLCIGKEKISNYSVSLAEEIIETIAWQTILEFQNKDDGEKESNIALLYEQIIELIKVLEADAKNVE